MSNELMSDDELIQAIFDAASDRRYLDTRRAPPEVIAAVDRALSDAIDRAMSHAYADGRADERREWLHKDLGTVKAIEEIWGLPPRRAA